MTVNFNLNGENVSLQTEANTRLLDILRGTYKLSGAKSGCMEGTCGVCFVCFNGKVTPSCMIPAFRVSGGEVLTVEGFSATADYQDIIEGFSLAGVENCGYCDAAKILTARSLLERNTQPSRQEIIAAFRGIRCRCTGTGGLAEGVLAAWDLRQQRHYGRSA